MFFFSCAFVRWRIISLATIPTLSATSFALAQPPKGTLHLQAAASEADEQQFLLDDNRAISNMNRGMLIKPIGDVDQDFVATMIPHHQGAIDLARAELKFGHNKELRRLAHDMLAQRGREISAMRRAIGEPSSTPPGGDPSVEAGMSHPKPGRMGASG